MSNSALIQKILFATDFSDPSENARKYACELANRTGAELHLLHVVVPLAVPAMGQGNRASNFRKASEKFLKRGFVPATDLAFASNASFYRSVLL